MAGGGNMKALTDLLLYWIAALFSSFFATPLRLPALLLYLIIGAILGNTGAVDPDNEGTSFFADWAITIVFFSLGFEETVEHFMEGMKASWGVALMGAVFPFGGGWVCGVIFWPDAGWWVHMIMAFLAAMAAVSLTMVLLLNLNLIKTHASMAIMTAAVIDDVGILILVAICLPIALAAAPAKLIQTDPSLAACPCLNTANMTTRNITNMTGNVTSHLQAHSEHKEGLSVLFIIMVIVYVIVFFLIITILHKVFMRHDMTVEEHGWVARIPILNKYGAKHILSLFDGKHVSLISVTFGLALGLVGGQLGFHPAIGAYFAGLILDVSYFELDATEDGRPATNTMEEVAESVCSAAFMWLGPVFFVRLGATLEIEGNMLANGIPRAIVICLIIGVIQFLSAALSAKYVPGGYTWAESGLIGFGMLGRAELYFVVLNEAKRSGILDREMFFTLALAALLLNISLTISVTVFTPTFRRYHPESEDPGMEHLKVEGEDDKPPTTIETQPPVELEVVVKPPSCPPSPRRSNSKPPTPLGAALDAGAARTPQWSNSHLRIKRGIGLGRSERLGDDLVIPVRRSSLLLSGRVVNVPLSDGGDRPAPRRALSTLTRLPQRPQEGTTSPAGATARIEQPETQPSRRAISALTRRPDRTDVQAPYGEV